MYKKLEQHFAYISTDIHCLERLVDDMRHFNEDNVYRYETAFVLLEHLAKKVKIAEAIVRKG